MPAHSRPSAGLAGNRLLLLLPLLLPLPLAAQTLRVATVAPAATNLTLDAGFEQSTYTGAGYDAMGPGWTFVNAGVNPAPGAWTSIAAPEGQKIAFLQGSGATITQTVNVPAGRHGLVFYAAQRPGNSQRLRISINGVEVGIVKPADSSFSRYRFDALLLSQGNNTLQFQALDGADNTVLIDAVNLYAIEGNARRWSDSAAWIGGEVPQADDHVLIPDDANIIVDVAPTMVPKFKTINIDGELHCADSDIRLDATSVLVTGRLICGAPSHPYTHQFELTLSGTDPGTDNGSGAGMGNKFLAAAASGVIELHGEQRVSWTQLAATASAGSDTLQLATAVDWREDDRIVIAPTVWRRDAATSLPVNEAEVVTISSVLAGGSTLEIESVLRFTHLGTTTNYAAGNGISNERTPWTLDERAEVGLLTHNIRIQGDTGSAVDGYGGHMMTMEGSTIHASGLELRRMGQKNKLARYPFHWHLAGEAPGQYIQNSSVYESYNRCVTVHGTHQVRVAGNVCYDFIGHGYFLEDGIERDNVFDGNLGIWARRPAKPSPPPPDGHLPLETDYREAAASNGPAVFWISNPTNTFVNNAASGSEGTGFWYHTEEKVKGLSVAQDPEFSIHPRREPFGVFRDNRVRASRQGYSTCEKEEGGLMGLESPGVLIERLMVTDTEQGIWPCAEPVSVENSVFRRAIVANTDNGMQAPSPTKFEDSVFIGYSANPPPRVAPNVDSRFHAVQIYDQGFLFDRVHFVNYDRPTMSVFRGGGGAHKLTSNRVSGLTFDNAPNRFIDMDRRVGPEAGPSVWGDVIHDLDGSFTGGLIRAVVSNHPLAYDKNCSRAPGDGISGYTCPYRYAHFSMDTKLGATEPYPNPTYVTVQRSDGEYGSSQHLPTRFIYEFMADADYRYTYRFDAGIARNNLQLGLMNAFANETSIHELLDVPADFTFVPGRECSGPTQWTQAASLADLRSNSEHEYWYNAASSSLLVKLRGCPSSANWYAWQTVNVCMGPLDPDGLCGARSRTAAPPRVRIESPADRAHVATGVITISAIMEHASGIRSAIAFIGEQASEPQNFAPEPPLQLPKDVTTNFLVSVTEPGSYPLRVVATNGDGKTYTAVGQIFVGQTDARVNISTPQMDQTLDAGAAPQLVYTLHNTAAMPSGSSFRLLETRVNPPAVIDHGAVSGSPINLSGWSQGRHDVEIALVLGDGTVTTNKHALTFHLMRDGQLADYEDGVDRRGSVTQPGLAPLPAYSDGQSPVFARDNGVDDINFFPVPVGPATPVEDKASYWLRLTPGLSLTGYNRLRITHTGPSYDAIAHFSSGEERLLGSATFGIGIVDTFSLPARFPGRLEAIELRHDSTDLYCTSCTQSFQSLFSISLLTQAQP